MQSYYIQPSRKFDASPSRVPLSFESYCYIIKSVFLRQEHKYKLLLQVLCPLFYWFSCQCDLINYPDVNQFLIELTQISGSQTTSCSKAISNWLQKVKEAVIAHRIKVLGITLANISGLIFTLNNCVIQVNNFQTVPFFYHFISKKFDMYFLRSSTVKIF